ncbi:MAG: FAD-dependent monooxygenase [Alphaproteobacteria bacterium]
MADQPLPVAIIGAGPTGLMLARCLQAWGVSYRIFDKKPGIAAQARALGVQARTLEAWAQFGLADKAVAQGAFARRVRFHAQGKMLREVPIGRIGEGMTAFPYLLFLDQPKTEALLANSLTQAVEWQCHVEDVVPLKDHARVVLATGEVVKARFVVGADGAHSIVRQAMGVALEGTSHNQNFYVTDVPIKGPITEDAVSVYFGRDDFVVAFPKHGEGLMRLVGVLPDEGADISMDVVRAQALGAAGLPLSIGTPEWLSTYKVHHRVVQRFWLGPLILAGDAAHIHSPVGAQGMNTGLIDAHNLGFRLALMLRHACGPHMLERYHKERHGFAMRLIKTTDQAFNLIASGSRQARFARRFGVPAVARFMLWFNPLRRFVFRTVSQIGIRYPAAAGRKRGLPRPGARFPWVQLQHGGQVSMSHDLLAYDRFTILDFRQVPGPLDIPLPFHHRIVTGPKRFQDSLILVRPDMVVDCVVKNGGATALAAHVARNWT